MVLLVFESIHLFCEVGQVPNTFKSSIFQTSSLFCQFLVGSHTTVVDCAKVVAILPVAVVAISKVVRPETQRIVLLPLCRASVFQAIVTTSQVL